MPELSGHVERLATLGQQQGGEAVLGRLAGSGSAALVRPATASSTVIERDTAFKVSVALAI